MNGIDEVILIGNLAQDPLVRITQQGKKVMFINIAVNNEIRQADGTRKISARFIPVSIFSRAEALENLLYKGALVAVKGHHAVYDKVKLSIVATDVQLLKETRKKEAQQPEKQDLISTVADDECDFNDDD